MKFSIVIPAYNEAVRIGETLRAALAYLENVSPQGELIVVNDGSTDATSTIARGALAGAKVEARLLENFPNRGKGYAVRKGLLAAQRPIGLFSDADLSTPLEETPKLVEPIANNEVDLAFGSRALDRSLIGQHQPWRREQGGRVFNLLVRLATGLPFWDTQCGFKLFRAEVAHEAFAHLTTDGFGYDPEVLYRAKKRGVRIAEVPVVWRNSAPTKVSPIKSSFDMFKHVVRIRFHR